MSDITLSTLQALSSSQYLIFEILLLEHIRVSYSAFISVAYLFICLQFVEGKSISVLII